MYWAHSDLILMSKQLYIVAVAPKPLACGRFEILDGSIFTTTTRNYLDAKILRLRKNNFPVPF